METAWKKYQETDLKEVMALSEDYKAYLDNAKTEREAVDRAIEEAETKGYRDISTFKALKAGDKVLVKGYIGGGLPLW